MKLILCVLALYSSYTLSCSDSTLFMCKNKNNTYLAFRDAKTRVIYVHERNGINMLLYPEHGKPGNFYLSNISDVSFEQTAIHFNNQGYDYYLYNLMAAENDDAGLTNGVIVLKGDDVVADIKCENPNSVIRCTAYDMLPMNNDGVKFIYEMIDE